MTAAVQPSFEDLGPTLRDTRFCVVDLETTGTGAESDITEIGAVLVQGGETIGEFQTLVNPGYHIPGMISVMTGITDAMVADAPEIDAVLPSFLEFSRGAVLVAHNARFDVGFLKRASQAMDLPWPGYNVVDTMTLARQALLRDEVPNVKLGTLANYFHTATQPDHRALSDARATVEVLHRLFERLGSLGVATVDDLTEFTHRVSPQRRAKRVWAKALPDSPGVYWFYSDRVRGVCEDEKEILYVGKSASLCRRVASYFTASETRPRMEEMVRVATGVGHVVCATPLEAEVRELRLIAAHNPRYNRRSKRQTHLQWLKLTAERFPRLSIVRAVKDDDCPYWGPFSNRASAEDAMAALQDAWGLRVCATPKPRPGCALGEMQRCLAPCVDADERAKAYAEAVDEARQAWASDIRPTLARGGERLRRLRETERFEEAAEVFRRLSTCLAATRRWHRLVALGRCPQIVAARLVDAVWHIHVIRHGMLAAAAVSTPGMSPRQVADDAIRVAATASPGPHGLPAGSIEEAERIADWLASPGVRLMDIDGDWAWPAFIGADEQALPQLVWG